MERLIVELAGAKKVRIEKRQVRGGTTCRRSYRLLEAIPPEAGENHYILLVDCGGDEAVASRIREDYGSLTAAGYSAIVGVRDVYPVDRLDMPKLEAGLRRFMKTKPVTVDFVLAVMETEAWFLAEHTHFLRIDASLTADRIRTHIGFDPSADDMQLRPKPSDDIKAIYATVGKTYRKHQAQWTVDAMDFAVVYLELPSKFQHLRNLVNRLESFLSP